MREANQHRRAGGRGLVAAFERFAGFDQRQAARRIHAERFEHFGGQDFAHAALERQAAVAEAAVGGLARALRAKVHQAAAVVAALCVEEAAAVADIGIVRAELVAVVTERQRLREAAEEGFESAEAGDPVGVAQCFQSDLRRRAVVAEAQDRLRETGGFNRIVIAVAQFEDGRLRFEVHAAIWAAMTGSSNHLGYEWRHWTSADGLKLAARDYRGTRGSSDYPLSGGAYAKFPGLHRAGRSAGRRMARGGG